MGKQVAAGLALMRKQVINLPCKLVPKYGGVAQLGEHLPCKQGVKSSNLSIAIRDRQISKSEVNNKV